ncbi:hypothetical protein JW835_06765 [bacterium]|nr:hypothetical protein [bacterium]
MNMKNTRMIRSGRVIYINFLSAWYYGYWGRQEGFGRTFMENAMEWLCPLTGVDESSIHLRSKDFSLNKNYPNPFNPSTHLCFGLPEPGHVELSIFNIKGEFVRSLADDFYGMRRMILMR